MVSPLNLPTPKNGIQTHRHRYGCDRSDRHCRAFILPEAILEIHEAPILYRHFHHGIYRQLHFRYAHQNTVDDGIKYNAPFSDSE